MENKKRLGFVLIELMASVLIITVISLLMAGGLLKGQSILEKYQHKALAVNYAARAAENLLSEVEKMDLFGKEWESVPEKGDPFALPEALALGTHRDNPICALPEEHNFAKPVGEGGLGGRLEYTIVKNSINGATSWQANIRVTWEENENPETEILSLLLFCY